MKVEVRYRNDPERPLTDPVLEPGGPLFAFRLYRGTFCHPVDGSWFDPNDVPTKVIIEERSFMPFVMWRWPFTSRAGYAGYKLYGVDSEHYKTFLPPEEVYPGSQACHFSIRPFANIQKEQ